MKRLLTGGTGFFALLLLGVVARAGGAVDLPSVEAAPLPEPIAIDGDLTDWPGDRPFDLDPFADTFPQEADEVFARVQAVGPKVSILSAYDADALYFGFCWRDSAAAQNATPADRPSEWQNGGTGWAGHFQRDGERIEIAVWPAPHGTVARWFRLGDGEWQDAGEEGVDAAFQPDAEGKGHVAEIRIPWALITADGKTPTQGKVEVFHDFAWTLLGTELLSSLPQGVRRGVSHQTWCYLTASDTRAARYYLNNPTQWGGFTFAHGQEQLDADALALAARNLVVRRRPDVARLTDPGEGWADSDIRATAFAPGYLGDRFAYEVGVAYDNQGLYLLWRGETPEGFANLESEASQAGYGGGDALQLRLRRSDGKVVNLCLWPDGEDPTQLALTADKLNLPDPYLRRGGALTRLDRADGDVAFAAYAAIPWAALGATMPKDGEIWQATFQPWRRNYDTRFVARSQLSLRRPGALTYRYEQPADGETALALFDAEGRLVRQLLKGDYRKAGTVAGDWDGLDQWGEPVPPGEYEWRGVVHPPFRCDYRFTVSNPGTPPWPSPDGKGAWLSDEASPQAAATDGEWIFLAAPGSEKGFAVMALDAAGQRQWGVGVDMYPRSAALAVAGDKVYALFSGPRTTGGIYVSGGDNAIGRAVLIVLDKKTGRFAGPSIKKGRMEILTWPYVDQWTRLAKLRRTMTFAPELYAGQSRYFCNNIADPTNALALAALDGKLYISLFQENAIAVFDAETAEEERRLPINKPVGIVPTPDGKHLAVVSEGRVVRLDPATGAVEEFIKADQLDTPHGLTFDAAGNLYVSQWGKAFQVRQFLPDGTSGIAYGIPGGRPFVGPWNENGMLLPRGIAATPNGELWVTEDDIFPKRISVWNLADGSFKRDYLGPTAYGGGTILWFDPEDETTLFANGQRYRVDWDKDEATLEATVLRIMHEDALFQPEPHITNNGTVRAFTREGRRYAFVSTPTTANFIALREEADGSWRTVAAMGNLHRWSVRDGRALSIHDSDFARRVIPDWRPEWFAGHGGDNYTWSDFNDDGLVQEDEVLFQPTAFRGEVPSPERPQPELYAGWNMAIDDQLSLFVHGWYKGPTPSIWRIDLEGWTPEGAPIYDIRNAKKIFQVDNGREGQFAGLFATSDGRLLVACAYESWGKPFAPDTCSLIALDREGNRLWDYNRGPARLGQNDFHAEAFVNEFKTPVGVVAASWLWHGSQRAYLVTSDGLYLGPVLSEGKLGPDSSWDESLRFFYQRPDGTPYVINGGSDAQHFLRIHGLMEAQRFSAPQTLTDADVERAIAVRALAVDTPEDPPAEARVFWPGHLPAPTLDGRLEDWEEIPVVSLGHDGGPQPRARLRRDADTLYLAYEVPGQKWQNAGQDWKVLFTTGDAVDFRLATDQEADPHREGPVAGDQRVVFAQFGDGIVAVRYRPVVAAGEPKTNDRLMAADFDEIVRLPNARAVVAVADNGYVLEAAIPLVDLGVDPDGVKPLRGDLGVVFADATGRDRERRVCLYEEDTSLVADLTTEARLNPSKWGPIHWPLGANMLKNGSFEAPFTLDEASGWCVTVETDNMRATRDGTGASGGKALALTLAGPVKMPEGWQTRPWEDVLKEANDGRGRSQARVQQMIRLKPNRAYQFRLRYRAIDSHADMVQPGPDRNYSRLSITGWWNSGGHVYMPADSEATPGWRELINGRRHYQVVDKPYLSPATAESISIRLEGSAVTAKGRPTFLLDEVEWVEMPEEMTEFAAP